MSNGVTDFSRLELNLQNCLGNYWVLPLKVEAYHQTCGAGESQRLRSWGRGVRSDDAERRADYLAVALPVEGMELRQSGINLPILVLTAGTDYFDEIIDNRLEPGIPNIYTLKALCRHPAEPRHRGLPDPHQTRHWNAPPRLHDQRVG